MLRDTTSGYLLLNGTDYMYRHCWIRSPSHVMAPFHGENLRENGNRRYIGEFTDNFTEHC
jgi:hypothetical protein